ncbi:mechanosensitive ion channel family protein, partial [Streptomyces sp. NPDC056437]
MNRDLTPHDWIVAGIWVAVGLAAGLLLRLLLRWLGKHATRTRWSGDDVLVNALRALVPVAALTGGVTAAAAALPLTDRVNHTVNQVLSGLLILAATITAARVITGLVQAVTQSRSG